MNILNRIVVDINLFREWWNLYENNFEIEVHISTLSQEVIDKIKYIPTSPD
jgi:hypothetical protein